MIYVCYGCFDMIEDRYVGYRDLENTVEDHFVSCEIKILDSGLRIPVLIVKWRFESVSVKRRRIFGFEMFCNA